MTTGEAFLRAVLDDPEDDGPRQAYAEWLSRRGNPRGEFIRIQLENARQGRVATGAWYSSGGADGGTVRSRYQDPREDDLLGEHLHEWLGPLGEWVDGADDQLFRRGFLERIRIDARSWIQHAEAILSYAPVRELAVSGLRPVVQEFFASARLAEIRWLNLNMNGLGDEDVACLAATPHLRNLRTLLLGWNSIGEAGAEALAASPNLPSLEELDFQHNRVKLHQQVSTDWDGTPLYTETPELLVTLVAKHGPKRWLK